MQIELCFLERYDIMPIYCRISQEIFRQTAEKRGEADSEGAWTRARASDGAAGPRDQPESSGKRPNVLTASQRDNFLKRRQANDSKF